MKTDKIERGVSITLAISALAIAAVVVYRQLAPATPQKPGITVSAISQWRKALSAGRQVGNADSKVQLIEFIDLQCPACEAFASTLREVRQVYGDSLGVTFVHFPLPMHKYADYAARIAECGTHENKFDELVTSLISYRQTLSSISLDTIGSRAGIRDLEAFERCAADTTKVEMVVQGLEIGNEIGINATPTILINGLQFNRTPTLQQLKQAIDALLAGAKMPFPKA